MSVAWPYGLERHTSLGQLELMQLPQVADGPQQVVAQALEADAALERVLERVVAGKPVKVM